jgi:hypothetical protein
LPSAAIFIASSRVGLICIVVVLLFSLRAKENALNRITSVKDE